MNWKKGTMEEYAQRIMLGEDISLEESFYRLPTKIINNEFYVLQKGVKEVYDTVERGDDLPISRIDTFISTLQKIKDSAKEFKSKKDVPAEYTESTELEEASDPIKTTVDKVFTWYTGEKEWWEPEADLADSMALIISGRVLDLANDSAEEQEKWRNFFQDNKNKDISLITRDNPGNTYENRFDIEVDGKTVTVIFDSIGLYESTELEEDSIDDLEKKHGELNWATAEIEGKKPADHPDYVDAYLTKIKFADGTEVTDSNLLGDIQDKYSGEVYDVVLDS